MEAREAGAAILQIISISLSGLHYTHERAVLKYWI
jgi:hypothetical protein